MRSWNHHTKGRHVRQARIGLGDLREQHISRQGFFGPVAMIYREHGPNEIVRVEGTLHPRRVADTARAEPSDVTDPRGMPELHDHRWPQRDEWELRVKHGGAHSSIFYCSNPLVSAGWKNDLFPYKLNIRDIIPIRSDRIHVASSAWCTFEATGLVVISLVPQIAVADLSAEELPSYHRNVDNDECVFVHQDESGARRPGMLSHTPQGILPGADEATRQAFQKRRTPGMRRTLCGVSVDTDRPLAVSAAYERLAQ